MREVLVKVCVKCGIGVFPRKTKTILLYVNLSYKVGMACWLFSVFLQVMT